MRRRKFLGVLGGAAFMGRLRELGLFVKPRTIHASLAVLALSLPAAGQVFEARALPPDEILTILYTAGLDPIGQPALSGTNYVIRARDGDDREVDVVIGANSGDILSKTPVTTASRIPPASNRTRSRGGSDAGPLIVDEDDSPSSRFYRSLSPGPVLRPPSRSSNAPPSLPRGGPMQPDKNGDASTPSYLNIIVDEPGGHGVLPPPERVPQRAAPTVSPKLSPKPVDRTAAVPPEPEPLPKPRPDAHIEAVPLPSPSPAASKRQPASLPLPPIPPRSSKAAPPHPREGSVQPGKDGDASAPSKPNVGTDEPDRDGVLPPPERVPRRAAPAVSPTLPPKPTERTAAAPPKPEPLPKPRLDANIEAAPPPSPSPAESKPQSASLPMPPIPPRSSKATQPRGGATQPGEDGDASAPPKLSPKPVDRTAAVPPRPEPLPKPRPDANIEAMPLPSPSPPIVSSRRPVSAPMLLTPPSLSNAAPPPRGTTQPNKSVNASAPSALNVIMADPDPDDMPPAPESASGNALHRPH